MGLTNNSTRHIAGAIVVVGLATVSVLGDSAGWGFLAVIALFLWDWK